MKWHDCPYASDMSLKMINARFLQKSMNAGAWKGRQKRFLVDPKAVEIKKRMVLISFENGQKINNFCFMHKGIAHAYFLNIVKWYCYHFFLSLMLLDLQKTSWTFLYRLQCSLHKSLSSYDPEEVLTYLAPVFLSRLEA